ncbi:hypothetical protein CTAYLR_003290 [Chrysophaeum taylorii]|uniref:Ribosomal protein L9 domain-containing protein n=1 Tax=Chrysophaeum taylorii TaxID=2483200 RepID=A0AAD7UC44_9STRA|nr:hypothetical protein CTAYLR_003290 [Chrysophaeum taylorii]
MLRRGLATRRALLLREFEIKGRQEPKGAVVDVAAGYLRNYLMPRNIAVIATTRNIAAAAAADTAAASLDPLPPRTVVPVARRPYSEEDNLDKYHKGINPPPYQEPKPRKGPFRKRRNRRP